MASWPGFARAWTTRRPRCRCSRWTSSAIQAKPPAPSGGRLARDAVARWKPDLLYLSDDDAVAQVARPLAGSALPIVFSGVNRSLAEHDLEGASNVTGVLEREHVVETLRLLKSLAPQVRPQRETPAVPARTR